MADSISSRVSVVVPVYNEAGSVSDLYSELGQCEEAVEIEQVIFIDDGSCDETWSILSKLAADDPRFIAIKHSRNWGQSAAIATGIAHSSADVVVTLDGDGQNVPADIVRLLDALTPDTDCVCGIRAKRDDSFTKVIASNIANRVRRFLLGDDVLDSGCGMRAIRRQALMEIPRFNGMHRFLPSLLIMQGFKVTQIPVQHRPRLQGVTKYGVHNRMWKGIVDCLAMAWFKRNCFPKNRVDVHSGRSHRKPLHKSDEQGMSC